MRPQVNYLDCAHCKRPMDHREVVAVPIGKGKFEFAHWGDCAKAVREGVTEYQLTIEDCVK
jgi:hypothetical protein